MEEKDLSVNGPDDLIAKVPDVEVVGDPEMFELIGKASSKKQGWMKSTKAMEIEGCGVVIQVSTQQRNPDGSYAVAEAITFVPGAIIADKGKNRCVTGPWE